MQRKLEHAVAEWTRAALQVGGGVALCALFTMASPQGASAGDDFERGFKRELGAIAAQEAVGIGRHILVGAVTGQYGHGDRRNGYRDRHYDRSHYARPYRYGYRPYRSYRARGHYRPVRRRVHRHHHDYHGSCDH